MRSRKFPNHGRDEVDAPTEEEKTDLIDSYREVIRDKIVALREGELYCRLFALFLYFPPFSGGARDKGEEVW